jgi:4-carboxymuconolactone decarboxylase
MKKIWLILLCMTAQLATVAEAQAQTGNLPADVNPVTLTRMPQLTRDDLSDEGKAVYDEVVGDRPTPTTGPVSISLYSPTIADTWNELNNYLRNDSVIGRGNFELAVLVAAAEIRQQYEYSGHEAAALQFGISRAAVDTVKFDREVMNLPASESLIIRLGRQLMRDYRLDSATFAEAVDLFGRQGVVELVTTMGDYVMVGMVLTAIDQHLPEGRPALLPEW